MNPESVIKLFMLDEPWSIGRRETLVENEETLKQAPVAELPFFAIRGTPDSNFKVIGESLSDVVEHIILPKPVVEGKLAECSVHFVVPPEAKS